MPDIIKRPPETFWFATTPDFADEVIFVHREQEGNSYQSMDALFKFDGRWYRHDESVSRFGGGGDGIHHDVLLPDATDENIRALAERFKMEYSRSV